MPIRHPSIPVLLLVQDRESGGCIGCCHRYDGRAGCVRGVSGPPEQGKLIAETAAREFSRVSPGICVIDRRDGGKLPCRSQDADSTPLHTRSIAGPGP